MVMILAAAFLSYKTTTKEVREANHFTWDAIQEVATLFIGIFVTMFPALLILKARGASLGVNEPWQYFWMTGLLSSFLDNTPTYLVFFTTAASSGLAGASMISTAIGQIPKIFLMAISCGAVFMGANTYIGNAPNFMVRSIAEENDIKMPSFFGYMGWSISCLNPGIYYRYACFLYLLIVEYLSKKAGTLLFQCAGFSFADIDLGYTHIF